MINDNDRNDDDERVSEWMNGCVRKWMSDMTNR